MPNSIDEATPADWDHIRDAERIFGSRKVPSFRQPSDTLRHHPAPDIVREALKHMEDRAATYDCPQGERSMAKTVEAFNALHGTGLTETDGWRFMAILKLVRSTQGDPRRDNWEDLAAYAGLAGESELG